MTGTDWEAALEAVAAGADPADLEHQTLDFKEPAPNLKASLKLLADAVVCFANAEGGVLVVGVRDRGPNPIVGVPSTLTPDVVRRGIFDRTRPQLTVKADLVPVGAVQVLVISVPPGVVPCATTDGTATRRLDRDCRPYTPDQQREWMVSQGHLDWSAQLSAITLDQLDPLQVERLRRLLRAGGRDDLARAPSDRLLSDLRLIKDNRLRNAGVLLVASEPAIRETVPTYGYAYQFRPTPGSEATARFRGAVALLEAIERLLDAVDSRVNVRPLNLAGGAQLALVDYPSGAVRELVVNAFIHRSYEANGTVEVEHSPDGLDVTSPGGLVAGVTPENILTHPSSPRNRLLTETVALLGLAERTGQGIDRAYRELLRLGKGPVAVYDSGSLVRCHIDGGRGNDAFARFAAGLAAEQQGDLDVLITLSVLCQRRTVGPKALAVSLQRSVGEAQQVLTRLASDEHNLIEPTKRGGTYRLTSGSLVGLGRAVRYHAAVAGDFDDKVVDHVREYGTITNRTLQRLFDLNVYGARDALRDLQHRGVLQKVSTATAGPGIRYGPGPNFPTRG